MAEDLLIVTDATGSMTSYLASLRTALPEILSLSKLSGVFDRIGVLAYRDYEMPLEKVIEWSGWDNKDITTFAADLKAQSSHGADWPEAAKTGLSRVLEYCSTDPSRRTLVIWYADAPPHTYDAKNNNPTKEREVLASTPFGSDWVKLTNEAQKRQISVFSFIPSRGYGGMSYYQFLSDVTGGRCITIEQFNTLSRLTLDVILQWTGLFDWAKDESVNPKLHFSSKVHTYTHPLSERPTQFEDESGAVDYLSDTVPSHTSPVDLKEDIPVGPLAEKVGRRNAGKRFANQADTEYRELVYDLLLNQINTNVHALTYNPVFGQLWRAVCRDSSEVNASKKQGLFDAFSNQVGRISDATQKSAIQQWLEDSFDSSEEIEQIIGKAASTNPRVYLDLDSGIKLTRRELLEVSKSCYSGVLKNLVSIFTHLKLADETETLAPEQRSIPLSLSARDFFRILPHLVVPGTLFPVRAGFITAILALVTGVPFLREPATKLLENAKGKWLDLEIPENVSFECARFLLSAPKDVAIDDRERELYSAMRRYQLLQLNLRSPINTELPWTPEKTREVGDFKVLCSVCNIKRSVTIMGHERHGVCGLCLVNDNAEGAVEGKPCAGASEEETCWVECSSHSCRAQYVVENVGDLKVRPKCHFCRNQLPCPYLECTQCTNRVVMPTIYRSELQVVEDNFLCPSCKNPQRKSTQAQELSIEQLRPENGITWLGLQALPDLLEGKSAFKLAKAHGFEVFGPGPGDVEMRGTHSLTFNGKKVLNAEDVIAQVERRVEGGVVDFGCCPLCFEDVPREKLLSTCGRKGCKYAVDDSCLKNWYGANEQGKQLNLMQTVCPFCRRTPTVKILRRYNPGVAALGGLRDAIADKGWYYAWCTSCGFAKRAFERQCCEGNGLPAVNEFKCDDCSQEKGIRYTPCPKCGVVTAGCNHITCPCGQHFCYVCGKAETESTIYAHLSQEHGGFFDEANPDAEYEGSDDEGEAFEEDYFD
ncbi:hypothetical protein SCHPADRAFT_829706 [Schizopora paradoxa]|uniref:RING-type domain-containing protein n=1 Tax=Schizopora paradoxa TaxID=27342 RepID=A0A0H2S616_9AGAM|nr:hypothetical protein SCHPADRAFT_829706 [Schizopora paradoxa]